MKWIKLFEEFRGNRVRVTSEEKKRLREITRVIINYCGSGKLTSGIDEKFRIEYDLGDLKNIIGDFQKSLGLDKRSYLDRLNKFNLDNGYKFVDDFAKKLSDERGVDIVFDRKNGCFTTKSGKAMTTINAVSEYPEFFNAPDNSEGFESCFQHKVFIDYKTGEIINDVKKNGEKLRNNINNYFPIWDFSGSNIFISINQKIRNLDEDGYISDIFSTLYHEFIHAKDPLIWDRGYLGNKEIYGTQGEKGTVYASHDLEVQTLSNQFLELIEYYFERTLRGDSDGNGVNYNLTKEEINKRFIPNILEIVDFINAKRDDLSEDVLHVLRNKSSIRYTKSTVYSLVTMRQEDPEDGKVIRQWLREDFTRLIDYYNTRVIEINKRKGKGEELPLLHKGFPFEVEPVKPTPTNVKRVQDEAEQSPKSPKIIGVGPPPKPSPIQNNFDSSNFKFLSNGGEKTISSFNVDNLVKLIEKYSRVFGLVYSKCYGERYSNTNSTSDIDTRLKTLLREVKTKDAKRIKEAVKDFFDNIGPKVSDSNVKNWFNSSDGRKWGEPIKQFEKLCSLA